MASRKAGKVVFDWIALSAKVPQTARAEFNTFRARYETLRSSLTALPEKPSEINWDFYKKNISKAGFVESFKKQYEALNVPYPENTEAARINAHKVEMEKAILEEIAESKARAAELQDELNKVLAQKPFEDMTIEEFVADKPELKAQAEDDIKNHRWSV